MLNALNASARNSTRRLSVNTKSLEQREIDLLRPRSVQNVAAGIAENVLAAARRTPTRRTSGRYLRCSEGSSPDAMRFGNCEPVPVFRLFVCIVGVNGSPV